MDDSTHDELIPSKKQQSWGALISIIIIVLMIVVGAFYSWGKRVAEVKQYESPAHASEATTTLP